MERKLSTDPYKGVRDFYPEDMAIQNHIFTTWKTVCERYGYEEYSASILEPTELYRSKTSDEIVNKQTYTFIDRGDRKVTLRPEMTPTVARMVAGRRRELPFPLRWYSIPNCFRYEQPQRGRVREFWQLNVDIFGPNSNAADAEILSIANDIMKAFGATDADFEIRINDRYLLSSFLTEILNIRDETKQKAVREILDNWEKLTSQEREIQMDTIIEADKKEALKILKESGDFPEKIKSNHAYKKLAQLGTTLANQNVRIKLDPFLVRGFDYYTGLVFEVFDTNPANPRALFGGGRYDRLLENFGGESLPAIGFGAGDVTMRDFLETRGLLPARIATTDVFIGSLSSEYVSDADMLAQNLREAGIRVAVYYGDKKVGDQIKVADKKRIPHVIIIGENERTTHRYSLKNLLSGEEAVLATPDLIARLQTASVSNTSSL